MPSRNRRLSVQLIIKYRKQPKRTESHYVVFFFFLMVKTLLLNLFNYIQFTNDINKNNSEQELYTKYVGKSKKQSYNIHWNPLKHACNSKGGKSTHYKSLKSNFPFTKETKDFSLIHILLNLSAVKRSLSAFTRYLILLTIHERITSQLCVFDWKTWRHHYVVWAVDRELFTGDIPLL